MQKLRTVTAQCLHIVVSISKAQSTQYKYVHCIYLGGSIIHKFQYSFTLLSTLYTFLLGHTTDKQLGGQLGSSGMAKAMKQDRQADTAGFLSDTALTKFYISNKSNLIR